MSRSNQGNKTSSDSQVKIILSEESQQETTTDTRLALVKSKAEQAFLSVKETILKNCEIVKSVNITDATSCNTAQQIAKQLNTVLKAIDTKRKELKQPSMDEGAMIDSVAKLLTKPAQEAIEICKSKIKAYDDSVKAKEKVEQKELPPDAVVVSESNVPTRVVWEFEITSVCALPKEWIILDEAKIKAWMKERGKETLDGEVINGVKFIKGSTVVLR